MDFKGAMWMTRESIIQLLLFVGVLSTTLYLFGKIVHSRVRYVRLGQPAAINTDLREGWRFWLRQVFGQSKLLQDPKSGVMHLVMFYGFLIIQLGAIDLFIKGLFPGKHLPVPGYSLFLFLQEITTFAVLLATAYAFYRRYIERLPRLKRSFRAGWVLIFLALLLTSILLTALFEKLAQGDPLTWFTPISSLLAWPLLNLLSPQAAAVLFTVSWWFHALILFSFLLYVPQSKHFHLIVAPFNVWLKRDRSYSKLEHLDFEDESAVEFGRGKIEDFRQDQLIDLYACVECGRCTEVCPAAGTGKVLSPMHLITNMRDHLTDKGAAMTSTSPWFPAVVFAGQRLNTKDASLIGDVVTSEELWACTTCRNCEQACPVMNEHVDKIIDMRRYLVMTEGQMDTEVSRVFNQIERQGNPWGISRKERSKWIAKAPVPVPTVQENPNYKYLLYVGSMGAYDLRSQKIVQTLVAIMHHARVDFAILGNEEKNSGDTARRLGNEFLFQQLAVETISVFSKYKVQNIVTIDPHALHTFKNEYPELGLSDVNIIHHTQLLADLIHKGEIKPTQSVDERITYHDSCYLGRYNGEFDAPRYILSQIPGVEVVEMERNRENGMCCGAGGGLMWVEETAGTRVNVARTEQALAVAPSVIGSACPYCLSMLSDGVKSKNKETEVQTMDVVEILALSISVKID